MTELIHPDWPVPANIRAISTTRLGGVSLPPFDSLNLAEHVGDDIAAVAVNRHALMTRLNVQDGPVWLNQVHGNTCVAAETVYPGAMGDATVTRRSNVVCAVMTADCMPLLLCDLEGQVVAAVHAGWRGMAGGVIENAIAACNIEPGRLLAWMGPTIGPDAFEVGRDVLDAFCHRHPEANSAFTRRDEKWLCDLYALARLSLESAGVFRIYGGHWCTYHDARRFFSYRRDGQTGRMATLIWRL